MLTAGAEYYNSGEKKTLEECTFEQCPDDQPLAQFLILAGYWSNDMEELANDLGVKTFGLDTREDPPREFDLEEEMKKPFGETVPTEFRKLVVRDMTEEEVAKRKAEHEAFIKELEDLAKVEVPADA
jgi:hypothetical protein